MRITGPGFGKHAPNIACDEGEVLPLEGRELILSTATNSII